MSALVLQILTGLASASALFLVASGLSLIFGVTRIVNFAHGSFYMLGLYGAVALTDAWGAGPLGFWGGVLVSALAVAALGALIEVLVLRRLYSAPELYQLLATFALVLVIRDAALRAVGPGGPARPEGAGAEGRDRHPRQAVPELRRALDLHRPDRPRRALAAAEANPLGPARRAATQDREMVGALGVNQRWLFTSVFALGTFLAALGGACRCRTSRPTSTSTWR
jgi:branched-chain amino acid transport system permease protein